MAIQPTRPIGSTQTLIFTGDLIQGNTAATVVPLLNGVAPTGATAANTLIGIRFLLADSTAPTSAAKTLPAFVYDDSQPAGAAPHTPATAGAIANITNANDLIIGATWAQNLEIRVTGTNPTDQALITDVDYSGVKVVIDTLTSGLGLNTGLPCVIIPMAFNQALNAWTTISLTAEITVRHTAVR